MPSRQNRVLVHAIWGLGGLTLGASFALLLVKNWTPDWIEATGTWFGAIATVLTLLWAVSSFRSDQAERERSRKEEHQKEVAEAAERDRQRVTEADRVKVSLRGGGGFGQDATQEMNSIYVVVENHSRYDAVIKSISLDSRLKPIVPLPASFTVAAAGDPFKQVIDIEPVPGRAEELSGKPLDRFTVSMTYLLDGIDWKRSSTADPELD